MVPDSTHCNRHKEVADKRNSRMQGRANTFTCNMQEKTSDNNLANCTARDTLKITNAGSRYVLTG